MLLVSPGSSERACCPCPLVMSTCNRQTLVSWRGPWTSTRGISVSLFRNSVLVNRTSVLSWGDIRYFKWPRTYHHPPVQVMLEGISTFHSRQIYGLHHHPSHSRILIPPVSHTGQTHFNYLLSHCWRGASSSKDLCIGDITLLVSPEDWITYRAHSSGATQTSPTFTETFSLWPWPQDYGLHIWRYWRILWSRCASQTASKKSCLLLSRGEDHRMC